MTVARADPNIRFDATIIFAVCRASVVVKILSAEVTVSLFAAALGKGIDFIDTYGGRVGEA